MTIRVMLADDHPAIIIGVRHTLSSAAGISVVADASNPKDLMEKLQAVPCDVLVTDFSMPCDEWPDGLVMLNKIHSKFPHIRVVVLTMLENQGLQSQMVSAGVFAVLNKRNELSVLPQAITAAFEGRHYHVAPALLNANGRGVEARADELFEHPLSPRELEVVRLFVGGMSLTDIALHLNRSIKTISTQKQSAMRKLGLANEADLYDYANKKGLRA